MQALRITTLVTLVALVATGTACSQEIVFENQEDIAKFSKRVGVPDGQRVEDRVNELTLRVQRLLGLEKELDFTVIVRSEYVKGEKLGSYNAQMNEITVYAGMVTDGILAHEIAHAVICNYFTEDVPEETQEILAQHVDQNLWLLS